MGPPSAQRELEGAITPSENSGYARCSHKAISCSGTPSICRVMQLTLHLIMLKRGKLQRVFKKKQRPTVS